MEFPSCVKLEETKSYTIVKELPGLIHRNVKSFLLRFSLLADDSINFGLKYGFFTQKYDLRWFQGKKHGKWEIPIYCLQDTVMSSLSKNIV